LLGNACTLTSGESQQPSLARLHADRRTHATSREIVRYLQHQYLSDI
jgi:hypothetical protein